MYNFVIGLYYLYREKMYIDILFILSKILLGTNDKIFLQKTIETEDDGMIIRNSYKFFPFSLQSFNY